MLIIPASLARNLAMAKSKKARSRKKKSRKKATVERSVQMTRMVVKMNQPDRKYPNALLKSFVPDVEVAYAAGISKPPGVKTMAKEIQKPA